MVKNLSRYERDAVLHRKKNTLSRGIYLFTISIIYIYLNFNSLVYQSIHVAILQINPCGS